MKLLIFIIAAAEAITATISNKALQAERFKIRTLRNRQWNVQRPTNRECVEGISASGLMMAMRNVAAKLEQRRRAVLKFNRMFKLVNQF